MKHQMNPAAVSDLSDMYYLDLFFKYYYCLFYEPNLSCIMSEARVKVGLNLDILPIFYFINILFYKLKAKFGDFYWVKKPR